MRTNTLMSLTPRISPRTARRIAAACGTGVLLVGASACGSSGNGSGTGATAGGPEGSFNNSNGGASTGQGAFPGANGKVVAVNGSTAQVQNQQDGQVAVSWNGSTTFTQQVSATLADVKIGSCVVVASAATGTGGATAAPTAAPTAVTATSVRVAAKSSDGTCANGFGGGGGGGPQLSGNGGNGGPGGTTGGGESSGQPPAGAPSGGPSGAPQIRGFGGAVGEVTAISGNTFVVKSMTPQFNQGSGSSTPSTQTTDVTVTVTKTTTYTKNGKAASADVKNGVCLRAQGTTDGTGAVTAKAVEISPATNGECSTGFRRSTGAGGPITSQES